MNTKSPWAAGSQPMLSVMGSEVVNVLLNADVAAANLGLGDLIILGSIPEDCALVDAVFHASDLDSGSGLVLAFGTINEAEDNLDTILQASCGVGQSAGASRITMTPAVLTQLGGDTGVQVGFRVATAAAGGQTGVAGVSLSYRAVAHGS
jgi:hypothetical protein